jgi:hypothetical protein
MRAFFVAVLLTACAAGAAAGAPSSGPSCSGFVTGEDYNSQVSIGGCKTPVKEIDLSFPLAVTLAKTYTLNGYGSNRTAAVPVHKIAAHVSQAFTFKTPLAAGTSSHLERGVTFSSWFEVELQPALPAGDRVYVTAIGTDGSKQTFYTTIRGMPYGG